MRCLLLLEKNFKNFTTEEPPILQDRRPRWMVKVRKIHRNTPTLKTNSAFAFENNGYPKGNSPSSPIDFGVSNSLLVSGRVNDSTDFHVIYLMYIHSLYVDHTPLILHKYVYIYMCMCVWKESIYIIYICTFVNPFLFKINPLRVLHFSTPRHVQQHCAVRDVILIKVSQFPRSSPSSDPRSRSVESFESGDPLKQAKNTTTTTTTTTTTKHHDMNNEIQVGQYLDPYNARSSLFDGVVYNLPCKRKTRGFDHCSCESIINGKSQVVQDFFHQRYLIDFHCI